MSATCRGFVLGCALTASGVNPGWASSIAFPPYSDSQAAAAAPVKSVNGQIGSVAVPAYQRQTSSSLTVSTADGTISWSFPNAFANLPTCYAALTVSSTSYTFDYPVQSTITKAAVTFTFSAHPKSLTVTSLALPVVLLFTPAGVPAGTTTVLTCWAPM